MKNATWAALIAAACLAGSSAGAADDTGAWYFNPMIQGTFTDYQRGADNGAGFQVGVGNNFAPNWAAEFNFGYGSFDSANHGRVRLSDYGVDVLRKFAPDSNVRPYLLLGVGGLDDEKTTFKTERTASGEVGAGLLFGLGDQTARNRLALRTEVKYRREFGNTAYGASDPNDLLVLAGLVFSFGNPVPAPTVIAPPPPLDSDGDGVTDDRDRCPGTPAGAKVDANGCEFDSDGDGVVDRLDQCPDTPRGTPVNAVGCPLDSDGDGVIDSLDRCPNTPKGDKVDVHGCTIRDEIKLPGVNFTTDSADLLPESTSVLDDAAASLKKYPELVVEVRGHTDSRGTAKHNLILSRRRAESVEKYLKDHGVTNTLTAKGFGLTMPIADNKTEAGRLENRRVTLRILNPAP